jgi:hypothetical protein
MKEKLCILRKKIVHEDIGKDAFFPVYNSDYEFMKRCKIGKEILWRTHKSRNAKHHKLIFAIAKCVIANMPEGSIWAKQEPYELIKACMVAEGIVDIKYNLDGTTRGEAKSIAFESMAEDEFQAVSDAVFWWGAELLEIEENLLRRNYIDYL